MANKIAGSLRLATAATIVLALFAAGYLNRSPWIVVLAAPLLTILYALGKRLQWRTAWRLGGLKAVARAFLITLPVQAVLAGYWRADVIRDALEGRSRKIEKVPKGANEEMIAETEAQLGFRLPEALRRLYHMMDGGYVGTLYVPLKAQPQPVYDDWRGAFSIDYSSLCPVTKLRTVHDHYQDFTHDPEEVPAKFRPARGSASPLWRHDAARLFARLRAAGCDCGLRPAGLSGRCRVRQF